ncbi:hypothetical protein H5410_004726 [Solanum commersonii]|uniref:Uncharacterized protein n=1 Tax=Solanum commersonii TaxID=4109 RepID=A0A9J6A5N4_SOLCO|nr:hypothetical protein H5410_004726 [Solanum commersonii]
MARGYEASHDWRKMMIVKDETDHNIWRQGALYYVEGENAIEEELEVQELIKDGDWDIQRLMSKLSDDMTTHVVENIEPPTDAQKIDRSWWMGNTQGRFTVWKRKIATDDNLKIMKISIVTRCWCCEEKA